MASSAEPKPSILHSKVTYFCNYHKPIKRKGWFFKPTSSKTLASPFPASAPTPINLPPKLNFRWWSDPQDQWPKWVEKLRPIYSDLWKKVGIFDAILASTYKFMKDPSQLCGVINFWCEESNTFLFYWGEVSITLEDVMILGGFSVIGDPVRVCKPLDDEVNEVRKELVRHLRRISNGRTGNHQSVCIKHFMEEGDGSELEHVAFLAFWLSRFVLREKTGKFVWSALYQVAVRLARGVRIALAPAVLAALYKNLRELKVCLESGDASKVVASAPFNLLQLWIWERFALLRPKSVNFVNCGEARAARWHNVGGVMEFSLVMSVLNSSRGFQWRPYVASLDDWRKPSFYDSDGDDEQFVPFARCLRACELVGIDCIEQYLPHRVAMQFGLDQDVPFSVPRSNLSWEVAWDTYETNAKNVKFYVPSQLYKPSVTLKYSNKWKKFQNFPMEKMETRRLKSRPLPCSKSSNGQALLDDMGSTRNDKEEERCFELKEEVCLLEEGKMMAPAYGEPIRRTAIFLQPTSKISSSELSNHPFVPSEYKPTFIDPKEVPKILFNGWMNPNKHWKQWVDKLMPIYKDLWQEIGIFYAIKASIYSFKKDISSLVGAIRFWSEETNTFIFPWGEATITLEDMMNLGGYPVLGESVRVMGPLDDEVQVLESKMIEERLEFNRTKCKKASHCEWLSHFIGHNGEELEHIAFLSLWLTRFVFPAHPVEVIQKHVFPIAIRLARGVRIALAPAVLASLYRDLSAIKCNLAKNTNASISVFAPLQILQLWLWERFVALRTETPNFVNSDEPRAARWHNLGRKSEFSFVMSVIESLDEFQWRPYTFSLDNWCKPAFYKDNGEWIHENVVRNKDVGQFAYCLRPCELVGLDCIEQYLPHRVALQLGLDQGIPPYVPRVCSTWQSAWKTYDISKMDVRFYVPPRDYESDVTLQYSIMWERLKVFSKNNKKRRKENMSLPCKKKRKLRDGHNEGVPVSLNKENHSKNGVQSGKMIASSPLNIDKGCEGDSGGENLVESAYDPMTDLEDVVLPEGESQFEEIRHSNAIDSEGLPDLLNIENNLKNRGEFGNMIASIPLNIDEGNVGDSGGENLVESACDPMIDLEDVDIPEGNSKVDEIRPSNEIDNDGVQDLLNKENPSENGLESGKIIASSPLNIDEGNVGDSVGQNLRESAYDPIIDLADGEIPEEKSESEGIRRSDEIDNEGLPYLLNTENHVKNRVEYGKVIASSLLNIDEGNAGYSGGKGLVESAYDPMVDLEDVKIPEEKFKFEEIRHSDEIHNEGVRDLLSKEIHLGKGAESGKMIPSCPMNIDAGNGGDSSGQNLVEPDSEPMIDPEDGEIPQEKSKSEEMRHNDEIDSEGVLNLLSKENYSENGVESGKMIASDRLNINEGNVGDSGGQSLVKSDSDPMADLEDGEIPQEKSKSEEIRHSNEIGNGVPNLLNKKNYSENGVESGKMIASDPLNSDEGNVGDSGGQNLVESAYDPMVDLEDVEIPQEKSKFEDIRCSDDIEKLLSENPDIRKLNEEIASIQAEIAYLESSMAEVPT